MSHTVIVVDNHPMILKFVASLLEECGHTVHTAVDGLAALELLRTIDPDIIFVDLVMPNISGEKLCRIVRRAPATRHIPLVVLSAIAAEEVIDVRSFGANLCIAKGPLDEIGKHVRSVMRAVDDGSLGELEGETLGTDSIYVRKISQELLSSKRHSEAILSQMAEGIIELDQSGSIIFANRSVISLLGLMEEDLLATRFASLFHDADSGRIEKMIQRAGEGLQSTDEEQPAVLRGRFLSLRLFEVQDDDDLNTVIVILEDVTERRRLGEQLERARKMEAMLAGAVAHDLNNILGGIVGYPDLLMLNMATDDPMRKPLMAIQRAGAKAAAVVQDLLSLARRGHTEMEVLDLNRIVEAYVNSPEQYACMGRFPNVEVQSNLADDLLPLEGSAVHLSTALMNLVFNAVEAVHTSGKVWITTENRYVDRPILGYEDVPEGEYVTLSVADTGTGMDPANLHRVFEPFFTKKILGRSGTGLGMAVVWGTVKDHQGYVDVLSTKGTGTTFTMYLPVSRRPITEARPVPQREEICGHGETILVVDDVPEQVDIATGMLTSLGYDVTGVARGEAAVKLMQSSKFDLVVLDMIMAPGIDGLETYRQMIKIQPQQKAVIVSGFAESDSVKETLELGAGATLRKPFLLTEIGSLVRRELDR